MFYNMQSALLSIWGNKVRSVLTVLGVVIGVASVTTLVSLGEGLKTEVAGLIQGFGTNTLFVTSGKIDSPGGTEQTSNPANFVSGDILTLDDVETVSLLENVEEVSPISLVPGALKFEDKIANPVIYGTYPNFLDIVTILPIKDGRMFTPKSEGNVIVLGPGVKTTLFGDASALNQTVQIGKDSFKVIGVLDKTRSAGVFGSEFDSVVIVPFDTATRLNKDQVKIFRIIVKGNDTAKISELKNRIHEVVLTNHNGEEDFSVLTPEDLLDLFNTFLNLATTMVSAIAAISLIVGGIGIMNIMLVTVTERTREIGLRKAVGATKLAILIQFLTEAVMVTLVGALIGLGIAFGAGAIITWQTELQPTITPQIIGVAVGISILIGIIFGLWPAIRAANKDPIEALRYE